MDFKGRQIVVTGGTGALGSAVVDALTAAGATCHVPCITAAEMQASRFLGRSDVKLTPSVDLTDTANVERFFSSVADLWGSIHLAGGFAYGALATTELKTLRQQIDMNFLTCLLCCRAAVATMARQGRGGRIVNVSARAGLEWRQGANMATYAAAKAAVAALTVALAEEVVQDNILVNAVAPSVLDTSTNRASMPKADFSTWPKVEEVAQTILFLVSPENRVTRGAVVSVYGRA
jgi:NAD(P)-dependent dehydrogenase (short-subunit alcohol dehydrogenase family)